MLSGQAGKMECHVGVLFAACCYLERVVHIHSLHVKGVNLQEVAGYQLLQASFGCIKPCGQEEAVPDQHQKWKREHAPGSSLIYT